jgi:hypothetical protein
MTCWLLALIFSFVVLLTTGVLRDWIEPVIYTGAALTISGESILSCSEKTSYFTCFLDVVSFPVKYLTLCGDSGFP